MVESIAFDALYNSRVLIIPRNADDFCLLIGLPDELFQSLSNLEFNIFILWWSKLKETLYY